MLFFFPKWVWHPLRQKHMLVVMGTEGLVPNAFVFMHCALVHGPWLCCFLLATQMLFFLSCSFMCQAKDTANYLWNRGHFVLFLFCFLNVGSRFVLSSKWSYRAETEVRHFTGWIWRMNSWHPPTGMGFFIWVYWNWSSTALVLADSWAILYALSFRVASFYPDPLDCTAYKEYCLQKK